MIPLLFQERGGRTTKDLAIRVLQGRGVGGSTVHNTNLCKRTPDAILDLWGAQVRCRRRSAAEMRARLRDHRARSVGDRDRPGASATANNDALRRGVAALGWKGRSSRTTASAATQSGFCELGCAYDAKQNALKVVLPQAVAAGARVYADVVALRGHARGARVTGIDAVALDGASGRRARRVASRQGRRARGERRGQRGARASRAGCPIRTRSSGAACACTPAAVVGRARSTTRIEGWRRHPAVLRVHRALVVRADGAATGACWIVPAFAHPIGAAAIDARLRRGPHGARCASTRTSPS